MRKLSKVPFHKLEGTGNDFIFFKSTDLPSSIKKDDLIWLCSRRSGVGADGVVIVSVTDPLTASYKWQFINADGGEVDMCGNAARCMAVYIAQEFLHQECSFEARIGLIQGTAKDEPTIKYKSSLSLIDVFQSVCDGRFKDASFVNTGVPHCVIRTNDLPAIYRLKDQLKSFVYSPEFGEAGANLTFYSHHEGQIDSVTFERGVDDFTLSCGTGAIASAFVYNLTELKQNFFRQKVKVPGGELSIRYDNDVIELSGPARVVYKGIL